ncbi:MULTISPECIES: tetratricopeptide repeat protein [Thalassolituus]|jgi:tetratricopeptide (TPR) repeat protein|uniref:tetratricopeptide repeat protein n=1 Tax=Thalassolituus TaxID=187492 RepID=UPI0023F4DC18|nr:tetratricopeptide repeat protein [Thalassolituus oleivorans]MDF1639505.1 tetratricopeptide repeat protein [Thalassolituus oleivorans]
MKNLTLLISAIALVSCLSGCSYERSNRMLKGYGNSEWTEETKAAPESEEITLQKVAEQAKKQHGLMHIHRYGEGYDILLTLDAGDSDVKFIMDLPSSNEEKASGDPLISDDAEQSAEDKALAEQGAAANEIEDAQARKIASIEGMTKHILNAQSLFYKKQYWDALDETNAALDKVPDSAQAHALKGSIYYKMGLVAEARTSWEEALRLDPELDQVKASLARLR